MSKVFNFFKILLNKLISFLLLIDDKYEIKHKLHSIWMKIWGVDPQPVNTDLFEDPERYNKLDNEETENYWKQEEIYDRQVFWLKVRRTFVGFFILILSFNLAVDFLYNIYDNIRASYLLNCLGREVCIYGTGKINYPLHSMNVITLDEDKKVFISNLYYYNAMYHRIVYPFNDLRILWDALYHYWSDDIKEFDEIFEKLVPGYKVVTLENYNKIFNKFSNLRPPPAAYDEILTCGTHKIIFYLREKDSNIRPKRAIYDTITKKYTFDEDKLFWRDKNDIHTVLRILGKYDDYRYLTITRDEKNFIEKGLGHVWAGEYEFAGWDKNEEPIYTLDFLKKQERLYLANIGSQTLYPLPEFAKPIKVYPQKEDIRILKNGKIIVPIRAYVYRSKRLLMYWDHIEIYDPNTNKFIAELNTEVLKENLFDVDLPNGDILFINKNSSWIFNNKNNKFEQVSDKERHKHEIAIFKLELLLKSIIRVDLTEPILEKTKIIKLDSDKFLLTCGDSSYSDELTGRTEMCKRTFYYNVTEDKLDWGPRFLYSHYWANNARIDENKLIVAGGHPLGGYSGHGVYFYKLPISKAQIIKWRKGNK